MGDECWIQIAGTIREHKDVSELTFLANVWMDLFLTLRKARRLIRLGRSARSGGAEAECYLNKKHNPGQIDIIKSFLISIYI